MALIVDASVVVKWILPEEHSDRAAKLRVGPEVLLAPDFLVIEVANVLVTSVRRGRMTQPDAHSALAELPTLVRIEASLGLVVDAFDLASEHARSVYDCLYVALAGRRSCRLVTADRKLINAMAPRLPGVFTWLGDL